MGFSRALRLIRSRNARLTCLAVGLRPKASLPPKVWQLPSATAEQSDTTLHPVTEDNHPRGEPHAGQAISISCAIGNNIVARKCPNWILSFFAA